MFAEGREESILMADEREQERNDLRRRKRKADWEAAMQDPLFLKDLAEVEADFRWADSETIRRID